MGDQVRGYALDGVWVDGLLNTCLITAMSQLALNDSYSLSAMLQRLKATILGHNYGLQENNVFNLYIIHCMYFSYTVFVVISVQDAHIIACLNRVRKIHSTARIEVWQPVHGEKELNNCSSYQASKYISVILIPSLIVYINKKMQDNFKP